MSMISLPLGHLLLVAMYMVKQKVARKVISYNQSSPTYRPIVISSVIMLDFDMKCRLKQLNGMSCDIHGMLSREFIQKKDRLYHMDN